MVKHLFHVFALPYGTIWLRTTFVCVRVCVCYETTVGFLFVQKSKINRTVIPKHMSWKIPTSPRGLMVSSLLFHMSSLELPSLYPGTTAAQPDTHSNVCLSVLVFFFVFF